MGMGQQELKDLIEKHRKWLRSEPGGERADLSFADLSFADLSFADLIFADLSFADLSFADLSSADLSFADLSSADLRFADLSSANLSFANLRSADLRSADLQKIKEDFFNRLEFAKHEAAGLYDYLMKGKIEGRSYDGNCACFVGTIANIRKEKYDRLTCGLKPSANSPTERWFLAITKGQTPQSNQVADITAEWLEEFCFLNEIELPEYKLISSKEFPKAFA